MTGPLREQLQSTLGNTYQLERELGGGGMSRVFLATDTTLGRKIVIKVLAPELPAGVNAERFAREIRVAARLQHPNIVPLHSAGDAGGLPYYTMPFVEGLSLRSKLEGESTQSLPETVGILRDVARALSYAHEHGVVHRDIKPENVLLSGDAAVVTDFGIAKAVSAAQTLASGETLTRAGTGLGTPAYMAPEQTAGDPSTDHRADIYSFGCLAYELLTGKPPFAGRQLHQLMIAHALEPVTPIKLVAPTVPDQLGDLVMQCLAKDPSQRPQSAREVVQRLESAFTPSGHPAASAVSALSAPSAVSAVPTVSAPSAPSTSSTVKVAIGVAALIAVALVAALLFADRGGKAQGSAPARVASVAVLPF